MRIKPPVSYVGTASVLAFCVAALTMWPAVAVFSRDGVAPARGLWFAAIALMGLGLTAYSARPKPAWLLALNWAVVPAACVLVMLLCAQLDPDAVRGGVVFVVLVAVFSNGSPFWLPVAGLALHGGSCLLLWRARRRALPAR